MILARRFFTVALFAVLSSSLHAQSSGTPIWKIYYDSAQSFWSKDWRKTISLLVRSEKSALNDLGIYDENYLTILNDLGLAYANSKDLASAEKILTKVISLKTEAGITDNNDFINSLNNLAGVHADQGHVHQAARLYKKIISISGPANNEIYWASVRNLLHLYETSGYLDSALFFAEGLRQNSSSDADRTSSNYELSLAKGRIKRKQRKYEEARVILETLSRSLQSQHDPKLNSIYIRSLQESGLVYLETGAANKAEKDLLQAFRLVKGSPSPDKVLLVEVLNNLASLYERLSIYDKATVYYQEALDRLGEKDDLSTLTLENNIAGIHLKQGDYQKAIDTYQEIAKKINTFSQSTVFHITVLNNLATALRKSNRYADAYTQLEEAYKLIAQNKLDNEDLAATVHNNMAVLLTARGEPDKAMSYYEKAYNIKRSIFGDNSVMLMDLAGNMGVVYWALGNKELAIPLFRQSIASAIRQVKYIFPSLSENEQVQFYQKLKEDFERFNAVVFQDASNNPELLKHVFDNQVVLKSLLFFTQQHRKKLIDSKKDSTLIQQYETLRARREQLGYFYQLSLKDLATADMSAADLEKEVDRLEKVISLKTSETISEQMMEREIRWEEVQSIVKPEEGLVEVIRFRKYDLKVKVENDIDRVRFGFTDSIYYAALVTTKETTKAPELVLMKEGINMETRFLSYYRNALTYYVDDENTYPYYWKPIGKILEGKSKIYFSPDGVYHRLNLNTLRNPETGQYLLQHYDIHYLLNPSQIVERQVTSRSSKKAVLFGDPQFDVSSSNSNVRTSPSNQFAPLPGTHKEVTTIDGILKKSGWASSVYLQKLATEKNLKAVKSPDILHLATHGFFSVDKVKLTPEAKKDFLFYSGLVFAGANKSITEETPEILDDGILTAYEVMNLDLSSTHLVVLSACETGLGKIENGEGVYGLQRSFLQAGARNILISLWKVNDLITQELMIQFYHHIFENKSERDALKLAQLDIMKKYKNPIGWGGFIVVGLD